MMFEDPIVNEIRKVREQIAAKFNYDIEKMCDHWREMEKAHPERLIKNVEEFREPEQSKKTGS